MGLGRMLVLLLLKALGLQDSHIPTFWLPLCGSLLGSILASVRAAAVNATGMKPCVPRSLVEL